MRWMETFICPFTVLLGKSFILKEHFKNKDKAFTASYAWPGRTLNVISLAKGSKSLCRLLQYSLSIDKLLAVLLKPSNQSLNTDHIIENWKIVIKDFLVCRYSYIDIYIYIYCDIYIYT